MPCWSPWLAAVVIALSWPWAPVFAAEGFRVEAARAGSAVAVRAQATVEAPVAVIWETITDYERLSAFVPGMKSSRVLARRGTSAYVEQEGEAGLLFITFPIRVVVESAEYPPDLVTIRVLRGNLKQLDGRYSIAPDAIPGRMILRWSGIIEADTALPGFIAVPLMRSSIEEQFAGMIAEIERRQATRKNGRPHARGD